MTALCDGSSQMELKDSTEMAPEGFILHPSPFTSQKVTTDEHRL